MRIEDLFSPLDGRYCNYFYYTSVLSFVLFVLALVSLLVKLFSKKMKCSMFDCLGVTQPLLMYFVSRLHYSICSRALM